jgi:hypothetical protein
MRAMHPDTLAIEPRPLPPASVDLAPRAPRLRRHPVGDPSRGDVERFVSRVYACRYGARIPSWAPELVSVEVDGEIVAAAGWRDGRGPLYLERYLDEPIERRIARGTGLAPPERARIAEVGHLAAARAGEGRRLMRLLGTRLASLGYEWVASTATPGVRAAFERIGVQVVELGRASARDAGPHAAAWGRYYERGPTVVAGELAPNLARVAHRGVR